MNELSISLSIAGRPYRLVIDKENEALFRKSAKLIEKRMKDYSGSYAYKDNQDLLAMVALEYATRYLRDEENASETSNQLENRLEEIDAALKTYLP